MTRGQKILVGIGILFLIWIINDPPGAAELVSDALAKLEEAANAIITFLKKVFA